MKKVVCILCLVVAVVLIGFGIYTLNNSNRAVFSKALQKTLNNTLTDETQNSFLPDGLAKTLTKAAVNINGKLTVGKETIMSVKGDSYVDNNNEYLNLNVIYDKVTTQFELLMKDSKLYHKIKDVYKNFYYSDMEAEQESQLALTVEDEKLLNKILVDSIIENMKEKDFTSGKEEITLENEKTNAKTISLNITEKKLMEILLTFSTKIEENKKLVDNINTALGGFYNIKDIIELLEEETKLADDIDKVLAYTIYIYKDEIVTHKFSISIESEGIAVPMIFKVNTYENKNGYDNLEMYLIYGVEIANFKITSLSNTKAQITGSLYQTLSFDGMYEKKSDSVSINVTGTMSDLYVNEEIEQLQQLSSKSKEEEVFTFNYSAQEIVKDQEYKVTMNGSVLLLAEPMLVSLECVYKLGTDMPKIDVTAALPIDKMTKEEREKLDILLNPILSLINIQI